MKVLLIGNDAFIAKALAGRFLLEEDQIYLLGEFKAEELEEFPEKIKIFNANIADESAGDVFSVQIPEVVIYFDNAQKDFVHDMVLDGVNEHMRRFMNAFALACGQGVKRFIYISTIDLYERIDTFAGEESPIKAESMWESAHYLSEQHIRNMDSSNSVFTLCLRVSEIYGPGQSPASNEIAYSINQKLTAGEKSEEEARRFGESDYLYIDDFCDAVYRAAKSTITGVLNIATGRNISTGYIRTVINKLFEDPQEPVGFIDSRDSVDVTLAATVMDYITHTDIVKGIRSTLLYRQEEKRRQKEITLKKRIRRFFLKIGNHIKSSNETIQFLPYVENLALFAGVVFLMVQKDIVMIFGFIDIRVLYILVIGAIFGLRQSILSTALCVGLLFFSALSMGYDVQSLIYDSNLMSALFVFLLAGLIFGYIRDRANQRERELIRSEAKTKKQLTHIKEMYLESLKVKDVLQGQIFNASNSYGRVFDMVYKLDSLDFNKLKGEIIRVTEEIMENRSVSLYMFGRNRSYLRLIAKSQGLRTAPKSVEVTDRPEIQQILLNGQIYVRHNIGQREDIVMAAPIENDEQVIAVLMIHEARLDQLSLSYQNLFKITSSLVSQSIERAYQYQQAQEDEWYISNTNILKKEYLKERIVQAEELQEQGVSNYVLLEVKEGADGSRPETISKMIREFDYLGVDETGTLCILLTNTIEAEAGYVLNRLKSNGIYAKVSEKVV